MRELPVAIRATPAFELFLSAQRTERKGCPLTIDGKDPSPQKKKPADLARIGAGLKCL
jgi:hypothetical protein